MGLRLYRNSGGILFCRKKLPAYKKSRERIHKYFQDYFPAAAFLAALASSAFCEGLTRKSERRRATT